MTMTNERFDCIISAWLKVIAEIEAAKAALAEHRGELSLHAGPTVITRLSEADRYKKLLGAIEMLKQTIAELQEQKAVLGKQITDELPPGIWYKYNNDQVIGRDIGLTPLEVHSSASMTSA
jgi:hypothetical protein